MKRLIFFGFLTLFLIINAVQASAKSTLKAGAAKRVITPQERVYLAGLRNNRLSTGVNDDLWVRALTLDDEKTKVTFVSLDLIGLPMYHTMKIRQMLKEGGINCEVILTCTHQHSGPDTIGLWGKSELESGVNQKYIAFLYEQIVECVKESYQNLRPAQLKLASTKVSESEGISKNSREPSLLDLELSLIKVEDTEEKTIATLINFAAHPETLRSENTLITADYPGYIYRDVEAALCGVALFVNGALGGMVTVDNKSHTFEEAKRIGSAIARAAIEALKKAEFQKNVNITLKKGLIEAPLENPFFYSLVLAGVIPTTMLKEDGQIQTEVNVIKIGDAQFATFPGEALPKLGFRVKERMTAKYKFIFGLANDELGYIIPEEDFNLPLYDYEKSMSVGSKIGTKTVEKLLELLLELNNK